MNSQRLSREEYKKSKELEELRKSGVAPAAVDEHGHMINPHIPEFISQQPWYSASTTDSSNRPSLKHQYLASHINSAKEPVNDFHLKYQKGVKAAQLKQQGIVKFKPGSCENCGATTHKTKECCDRPRARNAKYTKTQLQPDEYIVPNINLSYAAKHDMYNNHDPEDYKKNIQKWEKTELHRKKKKLIDLQQELIKLKTQIQETILAKKPTESSDNQQSSANNDTNPTSSSTSNEKKDESNSNLDDNSEDLLTDLNERKETVEKKIAKLQRKITRAENPNNSNSNANGDSDSESSLADEGGEIQSSTRDLRMREDTAKYLRNLDPNSAFYDPKTRSMRDNPYEGKNPNELLYAGDNFIRESGGGVAKIQELQKFVWDINKNTIANNPNAIPIHPQALPSASELLFKQARKQAEEQKKQQKQEIHKKYTQTTNNNDSNNNNNNNTDTDDTLRNPLFDAVYKDGKVNVLTSLLESVDPQSSIQSNSNTGNKSTKSSQSDSNKSANYPGNHTSEYGSYVDPDNGQLGYACCKQTFKNSYCIGKVYEKELQRIKDNDGSENNDNSSNSNSNSNNTNSNEPMETESNFNKKRKHNPDKESEDSLEKRFAGSVHN